MFDFPTTARVVIIGGGVVGPSGFTRPAVEGSGGARPFHARACSQRPRPDERGDLSLP